MPSRDWDGDESASASSDDSTSSRVTSPWQLGRFSAKCPYVAALVVCSWLVVDFSLPVADSPVRIDLLPVSL